LGLLCLIDPITPKNLLASQPRIGANTAAVAGSCTRRRPLAWLRELPRRVRGRCRWSVRISKLAFCDLWIRSGRRLPVYWRDFYCDEKLYLALDRYTPLPYPGSFVIFRQPNNGTEAGWRSLASGTVDFQETWVDHSELLEEPYVQILAGKLRSYLGQAQSGKPEEGHRESSTDMNSLSIP